jgi:hypothetical protein
VKVSTGDLPAGFIRKAGNGSGRFYDFAALQASSTDFDALGSAADRCAYVLQVGFKPALSPVVGMT